jgi:hypothetical protein
MSELVDFSAALLALKAGKRVARTGWNGKGMWITYAAVGSARITTGPGDAAEVWLLPFVVMRTAQGDFVPWLASQTDLLAEDWQVLD